MRLGPQNNDFDKGLTRFIEEQEQEEQQEEKKEEVEANAAEDMRKGGQGWKTANLMKMLSLDGASKEMKQDL